MPKLSHTFRVCFVMEVEQHAWEGSLKIHVELSHGAAWWQIVAAFMYENKCKWVPLGFMALLRFQTL